MKKLMFVFLASLVIASMIFTACAPRPKPGVAILVLDDFVDEVENNFIVELSKYEEIAAAISPEKNCIYNMRGEGATVSVGAGATVSVGAGNLTAVFPAPHGKIAFEELRSIIERTNDPQTGALANSPTGTPTTGAQAFGLNWIHDVIYYTNTRTNELIALIAVDTSDYTTEDIVARLQTVIDQLDGQGYSKFVINMSFVVIPCPVLDQTPSFLSYDNLIKKPELNYLEGIYLNLKDEYESDKINRIANLKLSFQPEFGPLRLQSYYASDEFNFADYQQLLAESEPLKIYINQLIGKYQVIVTGSAGNGGLPYPYAPAMWDEVLSVSSPIDDIENDGTQFSNFILANGDKERYKVNSGEVVAEGCTEFRNGNDLYRIAGTSFAAPKISYLAALYLLQDQQLTCMGTTPVPPLGYADEQEGDWQNMDIETAAAQYCQAFPADVTIPPSCP